VYAQNTETAAGTETVASTELVAGERAFRFALAGLAVWRLTHLLALEDGPADAIAKLRLRAGSGSLGELMDCFDCLSIWVAASFVPFVARRPGERAASWLALSGVACAMQRLAGAGEEEEEEEELELDLMADTGARQDELHHRDATG
jgi:Protein of unknown function (DUF1360)